MNFTDRFHKTLMVMVEIGALICNVSFLCFVWIWIHCYSNDSEFGRFYGPVISLRHFILVRGPRRWFVSLPDHLPAPVNLISSLFLSQYLISYVLWFASTCIKLLLFKCKISWQHIISIKCQRFLNSSSSSPDSLGRSGKHQKSC